MVSQWRMFFWACTMVWFQRDAMSRSADKLGDIQEFQGDLIIRVK
jgi:hypothetical protein